jgi:hypothetical protein
MPPRAGRLPPSFVLRPQASISSSSSAASTSGPSRGRVAWVERNPVWCGGIPWRGTALVYTRTSYPLPVCAPLPQAEAFRVCWHLNHKQWFHGLVTLARGAPCLLSLPEPPLTEPLTFDPPAPA